MTARKETALMANAIPTPTVAISTPATAGPINRPMLWTVELRAWALT